MYSKSISNTSNDHSLESKRSSNFSDSESILFLTVTEAIVNIFGLASDQLYENHREKVAHKDATSITLRLRKLLEEEKSKGETLRKEVEHFRDKTNSKITVTDIIR